MLNSAERANFINKWAAFRRDDAKFLLFFCAKIEFWSSLEKNAYQSKSIHMIVNDGARLNRSGGRLL